MEETRTKHQLTAPVSSQQTTVSTLLQMLQQAQQNKFPSQQNNASTLQQNPAAILQQLLTEKTVEEQKMEGIMHQQTNPQQQFCSQSSMMQSQQMIVQSQQQQQQQNHNQQQQVATVHIVNKMAVATAVQQASLVTTGTSGANTPIPATKVQSAGFMTPQPQAMQIVSGSQNSVQRQQNSPGTLIFQSIPSAALAAGPAVKKEVQPQQQQDLQTITFDPSNNTNISQLATLLLQGENKQTGGVFTLNPNNSTSTSLASVNPAQFQVLLAPKTQATPPPPQPPLPSQPPLQSATVLGMGGQPTIQSLTSVTMTTPSQQPTLVSSGGQSYLLCSTSTAQNLPPGFTVIKGEFAFLFLRIVSITFCGMVCPQLM